MVKPTKGPHVGKLERRILDILQMYPDLTARDIAEILWARNIRCKTAEYSSVHRSLRSLYKKGLVKKMGGQVKWRKTNSPVHASRALPRKHLKPPGKG